MLRESIVVATLLVWSIAAHGEGTATQSVPSANDVAQALKTVNGAGEYLKAKRAEYVACEAKIRATPEFKPIAGHIPPPGGKPTAAQFADTSLITSDEARAMAVLAPKYKVCRSITENAEASLLPAMEQVYKDSEDARAALVANLIDRRLSWGSYYKAIGKLSEQTKARRAEVRSRISKTAK
jgi:hypothetical protein